MIALKEQNGSAEISEKAISAVLIDAGIKPCHSGFTYLKAEIKILLSEPDQRHGAMQLYDRVAKIYGTSHGSVEHAVRYTILHAYLHDHDKLQKFMQYDDGRIPTHYEFVCWAAEKIRIESESHHLK